MKIRFTKLPDLSRLCLMSAGLPDWHTFKNTFILDRSNLRQFIDHHRRDKFDGKFVFFQGKLALHEGEEVHHRQLRQALPAEAEGAESPIGAWLEYAVKENQAVITLYDRSGLYGRPSRQQFARVAERLATELACIGLTSERSAATANGQHGYTIKIWLDKNVE